MEIRSKLVDAEVERTVLDARRTAERELFEKASFEPEPAFVIAAVEAVPEVLQLRQRIDDDRTEMEAMERRAASGKAETNPVYRQLRERVAADEATLAKVIPELKAAETERLKNQAMKRRQDEIDRLDTEYSLAEATIRILDSKLDGVRKERQEQAKDSLDLEIARAEYERMNQFLNAISTRITDMTVQRQAPQRVELFQAASVPTRPDEAIPYKNMGMAGFLAFMLPFAAAVGIEVLYRRVSSRQQLESAGQISVVAEVTTLPKRIVSHRKLETGVPPKDMQLFEESIDGLRTYLSLVETMHGRKVLAVTSAISREGKTSLAAQLAVSIASTTSRPTLLIDGDMRSPDIHRIFDVDCGPGLCEVLRGDCPVEEAIETDFSDSLHLLTAGELRGSPHRILGDGKFTLLLDQLRGMYDYVVVDTPPILAASESLLMASSADAAILCVRRDFSRIDQVTTAFNRLKSAGVKTAGAVLNGVPTRQYAYHYGGYYYTRGNRPEPDERASTAASA
jgi:capsular exopolysaccharide synthesis family protein